MGLIIFFIIVFLLFIIGIIIYFAFKESGKQHVIEHSVVLKSINEINQKYHFHVIPNYDMKHSYDNEFYYDSISPEDYLIYQLVYINYKVERSIKMAQENKKQYDKYENEVKSKCVLNNFNTPKKYLSLNFLNNIEEELFLRKIKHPTTQFTIRVRLVSTQINGVYKGSKSDEFNESELLSLIGGVRDKRGTFFCNRDIWNAIVRVERGKVSNKMRFSIFARDGYRCKICGSNQNLEIDHIIPISKGGKSTYDNLQTLCRRCNYQKGSDIYKK